VSGTHCLELLEVPRARRHVRLLEALCELCNPPRQCLLASRETRHDAPFAWTSQLMGAFAVYWLACATGASAAAGVDDEPPKSMDESPWPMVLPTATDPAVAAICAIMPGWPDDAAAGACAAAGGAGACGWL
jgi:hypothetical protein